MTNPYQPPRDAPKRDAIEEGDELPEPERDRCPICDHRQSPWRFSFGLARCELCKTRMMLQVSSRMRFAIACFSAPLVFLLVVLVRSPEIITSFPLVMAIPPICAMSPIIVITLFGTPTPLNNWTFPDSESAIREKRMAWQASKK